MSDNRINPIDSSNVTIAVPLDLLAGLIEMAEKVPAEKRDPFDRLTINACWQVLQAAQRDVRRQVNEQVRHNNRMRRLQLIQLGKDLRHNATKFLKMAHLLYPECSGPSELRKRIDSEVQIHLREKGLARLGACEDWTEEPDVYDQSRDSGLGNRD